jgi:DNA-binding LytR/AlgR family response regulator
MVPVLLRCKRISDDRMIYVPPEQVNMIKAAEGALLLFLRSGETATMWNSLSSVMKTFPDVFARASRDLVIRRQAILYITGKQVFLEGGEVAWISKRQFHHVYLRALRGFDSTSTSEAQASTDWKAEE